MKIKKKTKKIKKTTQSLKSIKKPIKKPIKKTKKTADEIVETTVFMNGQSEAVRIPKQFRLGTKKVYIKKSGNCIMLIPVDDPWHSLINAIGKFSDDFMKDGREQPPIQEREELFP